MTKMSMMGMVLGLLSGCDMARDRGGQELSDLEAHLVGVWMGDWGGGTVGYLVLNEDRTACDWMREGDDHVYRYNHTRHVHWALQETLEDNDRMVLELTTEDGDVWTYDRYDPFEDRIMMLDDASLSLSWRDILIACEDDGMEIIAYDVTRGGHPYDEDADNQSGDPSGNGSGPGNGGGSEGGAEPGS